jgi:hypothetical protein
MSKKKSKKFEEFPAEIYIEARTAGTGKNVYGAIDPAIVGDLEKEENIIGIYQFVEKARVTRSIDIVTEV